MCIKSLPRKSVFVELGKSSVEIDQLANRLGGNCYLMIVEDGILRQSYLFELEGNASQFFKQIFNFPEVICAGFDS